MKTITKESINEIINELKFIDDNELDNYLTNFKFKDKQKHRLFINLTGNLQIISL